MRSSSFASHSRHRPRALRLTAIHCHGPPFAMRTAMDMKHFHATNPLHCPSGTNEWCAVHTTPFGWSRIVPQTAPLAPRPPCPISPGPLQGEGLSQGQRGGGGCPPRNGSLPVPPGGPHGNGGRGALLCVTGGADHPSGQTASTYPVGRLPAAPEMRKTSWTKDKFDGGGADSKRESRKNSGGSPSSLPSMYVTEGRRMGLMSVRVCACAR